MEKKIDLFLKEYQLEELRNPFNRLKEKYLINMARPFDEEVLDAHVLYTLVKMNTLNVKRKNNPNKIIQRTLLEYFDVAKNAFLYLGYEVGRFQAETGLLSMGEYLIPRGLESYKKKVASGAKKLRREFGDYYEVGEVFERVHHLKVMECPYELDALFFERLHIAFRLEPLNLEDYELSDEFLFLIYSNRENHWALEPLAFTALLFNPYNLDAILEVARMKGTYEKGIRDSIMDHLIHLCERYYVLDEGDLQLIETKPYLRILHQKALWLLEDDKVDEAKAYLFKCLEIRPNDPMGVRFILDEIDDDFDSQTYEELMS